MSKKSWWLVLAVIVLSVIPLFQYRNAEEDESLFSGADGQAEEVIAGIDAEYKPWATPLFTPPSGEIESALFAVQAALGAGLIGYYFGLRKGRSTVAG